VRMLEERAYTIRWVGHHEGGAQAYRGRDGRG